MYCAQQYQHQQFIKTGKHHLINRMMPEENRKEIQTGREMHKKIITNHRSFPREGCFWPFVYGCFQTGHAYRRLQMGLAYRCFQMGLPYGCFQTGLLYGCFQTDIVYTAFFCQHHGSGNEKLFQYCNPLDSVMKMFHEVHNNTKQPPPATQCREDVAPSTKQDKKRHPNQRYHENVP